MIIEGILFDLDGVLVDTETKYTEFWNSVSQIYPTGYDDFAYRIKGNNLKKILTTYFPNLDIQSKIVELIDEYEANMTYDIFPGVIEFIKDLKKRGIPMAVVTSSDKNKMEKLFLQHPDFKDYFNAIITGDMVKHSKPNPECFLLGAKMIDCEIKNCLIFEDSPSGIEAGFNAGATVVALATTLHKEDINKKVFKIIDNFKDFNFNDLA